MQTATKDAKQMTQAQIFKDFMRAVWRNDICDVTRADQYETYQDAQEVAQVMGAKLTSGVIGYDDLPEWLFPDGSTVGIQEDGHGTTV